VVWFVGIPTLPGSFPTLKASNYHPVGESYAIIAQNASQNQFRWL